MRSPLAGLVLIMDVRHPLTDLDRRMIAWVAPSGKPIHVLLSKSDKLSRQQSTNTLRTVQKALAEMGDEISVQLFSSLKKTGIEEAEVVLGRWLGMEPVAKKKPPVSSGGKQP
jgi:GTP-binding protein